MTRAKAPKNEQTQADPDSAEQPQEEVQAAPEPQDPTKVQVAKAINATVRVPRLDKDREPVVERGVYATQERAARAEDILAFRVAGDRLTATTVDGQKHEIRR